MNYIDEGRINDLLERSKKVSESEIDRILEKSRSLKRLTLEETAALITVSDPQQVDKIYRTAAYVKNAIYGKRIVLFAPLYISNICANQCLYCAFNAANKVTKRRALTIDEIRQQTEWLLKRGHKRILMVAGESLSPAHNVDYFVDAVKAIYSAQVGPHRIKRVNVNCAPLSVEDLQRLKNAGIGTYQVFQETYHDATYRAVHVKGPKTDPNNRLDAIDRAFAAGIDDVGIGVLYGLYDWRFETLALMMHIEHLEKKFNVGPHTISVPRIEPAAGSEFSTHVPHQMSDEDFKKLVAVLRLSVPYTGIILSTRETSALRDELFNLGVSQVSAESRTSPGGYSTSDNNADTDIQFTLGDQRTLDEVMGALIEKGFVPSFCAACYRKERTGEAFMNLAKPGTIKGMCSMNALITLREYLDDFASDKVKKEGYALIEKLKATLTDEERKRLETFFADIEHGIRDEYV